MARGNAIGKRKTGLTVNGNAHWSQALALTLVKFDCFHSILDGFGESAGAKRIRKRDTRRIYLDGLKESARPAGTCIKGYLEGMKRHSLTVTRRSAAFSGFAGIAGF